MTVGQGVERELWLAKASFIGVHTLVKRGRVY